MVDTAIYYVKTASGVAPFFVSVYNKQGELTLFQEYSGDWKKRYLSTETVYSPYPHQEKITHYFESGRVRVVQYRLSGKEFGDYVEYDEQGKIIRQWKYDSKGKVIK